MKGSRNNRGEPKGRMNTLMALQSGELQKLGFASSF